MINRTNLDPSWVLLKESLYNLERRLSKLERLEVVTASQVQAHVSSSLVDVAVANFYQDIPDTQVQIMPGSYVIAGNLFYTSPSNTNDDGQSILMALNINGTDHSHICESSIRLLDGVQPFHTCISTAWDIEVLGEVSVVKLRVAKTGGAGGTIAHAGCSLIVLGARS